LYVGNTETEVCGVAQDETTAEEKTYGENRAHKHDFRKLYILCTIEKARRPFKYARAGCLKRDIGKMVCKKKKKNIGGWLEESAYGKAKVESDEKDGVLEVEGVVQIVVVDDDARG
jgi:hypothetical protein